MSNKFYLPAICFATFYFLGLSQIITNTESPMILHNYFQLIPHFSIWRIYDSFSSTELLLKKSIWGDFFSPK